MGKQDHGCFFKNTFFEKTSCSIVTQLFYKGSSGAGYAPLTPAKNHLILRLIFRPQTQKQLAVVKNVFY